MPYAKGLIALSHSTLLAHLSRDGFFNNPHVMAEETTKAQRLVTGSRSDSQEVAFGSVCQELTPLTARLCCLTLPDKGSLIPLFMGILLQVSYSLFLTQ